VPRRQRALAAAALQFRYADSRITSTIVWRQQKPERQHDARTGPAIRIPDDLVGETRTPSVTTSRIRRRRGGKSRDCRRNAACTGLKASRQEIITGPEPLDIYATTCQPPYAASAADATDRPVSSSRLAAMVLTPRALLCSEMRRVLLWLQIGALRCISHTHT